MTDADVAWVILVCGFMGSLIGILIRTGSTSSFTQLMSSYVRSEKSALMATWGLGILMFVDDYLNSLAVGSAMRSLTDKYKVSREKLAYVVDSTAAPISVIIPFSTWGVFFSGLIVANGIAPEGQGFATYISAIPYMLYAWVAVLDGAARNLWRHTGDWPHEDRAKPVRRHRARWCRRAPPISKPPTSPSSPTRTSSRESRCSSCR